MKRPTIIDVARGAGVSKSLVSLVMRGASNVSDEKRQRVMTVAAQLGYRPNAVARSLVQRRTSLLGVLLSDLHNPFFAEVIDGIQAEAAAYGYRTILGTGDRVELTEARALETMLELRAEGLILASPVLPMRTIAAASRELPTVLVARRSRVATVDSVTNDDVAGAALAVAHLAALGHERIAHIDGGEGAGAPERRRGYERAMRKHGFGARVRIVPGNYTEDGGRRGVSELLSGEMPTAIFAANDLAAIGTLSALAERDVRVPEDVSVVGYDNTALAAVRLIHLTTVDQPRPEMGRAAVTLLLERLEGGRRTIRNVLMPPSLVVRGSTAAPRPRGSKRSRR
ncbi:MAG TPA: LacI family DNA-binding transcriptional regulator [Gemmatimonadota bacterium]|nr:LacI family DNA-binding transcriptional regulator [Gemmatimonadota bacterium]